MDQVTVTFMYNEAAGKWSPYVHGVENETEARQAFSAVVITCQQLNRELLPATKVFEDDGEYEIIPAV